MKARHITSREDDAEWGGRCTEKLFEARQEVKF